MRAQAAVLLRVNSAPFVTEIEVAAPRRGEVLVRMVASGLCGSDLHVLNGHRQAALPAVLGHEGAGIVEAVGPGVSRVRPGDHVILLWRLGCGNCDYCLGGRPALCDSAAEGRRTGRLPEGGARFTLDGQELCHFAGVSSFSEYTVVPERATLVVPADLPLEIAAVLGCGVITGAGAALNAGQVVPGSAVAVFGAGGVGLNVIQGARLAGADPLVAVDLVPLKLDFARQFGATHVVDASAGDAVAQVRAVTGGRGVDRAFEVVGDPRTVRQAYDSLAKRGRLIVVGVASIDAFAEIPLVQLVQEERSLAGSLYGSSVPQIEFPRLIRLYRSGRLKLDELISRRYPLAQFTEAVRALEGGEVARALIIFGDQRS